MASEDIQVKVKHPDEPERYVNVSFEHRWSKLKDWQPSDSALALSLNQLLTGFFNYYLNEYKSEKECISISHYPLPLTRKQYPKETRFLDSFYSFPVLDPFNDTYCPARQCKVYSSLDSEYR